MLAKAGLRQVDTSYSVKGSGSAGAPNGLLPQVR